MHLHVVSQRSWMAREAEQALQGWQVHAHHGLSALPPEAGAATANLVWAPGAYFSRSIVHGSPVRLAAPKPWALTQMDRTLLDRPVEYFSAAEAHSQPREGFWKLADVKDDNFPAQWRTAGDAKEMAEQLPAATGLLFCPTRLDFTAEFRVWVLDGRVIEFVQYVDERGLAHDHPDYEPSDATTIRNAYGFARDAAWNVGGACVMDVGYADRWMVIELNPVWSSNWYSADLNKIVNVIEAAEGPYVHRDDLWVPDPLLVSRALRLGPLPVDGVPAPR